MELTTWQLSKLHFVTIGASTWEDACGKLPVLLRHTAKQVIAPGTICPPPPMAVRLAADLRPSTDGSPVRTWLSCRQQHAYSLGQLRHGTDRQRDGSRYRLMPPTYMYGRGYNKPHSIISRYTTAGVRHSTVCRPSCEAVLSRNRCLLAR